MVRVVFEDEDLFNTISDMVRTIMTNKGMLEDAVYNEAMEDVYNEAVGKAWNYVEQRQGAKMFCKMSEIEKIALGVVKKAG